MVGSIRKGPGASWEPHGSPMCAGSVGDGHYLFRISGWDVDTEGSGSQG